MAQIQLSLMKDHPADLLFSTAKKANPPVGLSGGWLQQGETLFGDGIQNNLLLLQRRCRNNFKPNCFSSFISS